MSMSVTEIEEQAGRRATQLAPLQWGRVDEAAARRALRAQIRKLEGDLAALAADASPRDAIRWAVGSCAGPRLLGLGELERTRDDLAERLHAARAALAERHAREALKRDELARMLRNPEEHRFVRISRADVGEPGCGAWESRPRLGLVGMLAGWWEIKVSSGCPLAGAPAGPTGLAGAGSAARRAGRVLTGPPHAADR